MADSSGKALQPEVPGEYVKVCAESIGISTAAEDACKFLAEDVTFRLKTIIQDALKLANHSKRQNVTTNDIDFTLKMKHYEPLYGFTSADYIPFRNASGGGRDVYFTDEKEVDLDELTAKPLPKLPLQCSLKAHWLAIEGVQPAIPENPPPLSKDAQKIEGINPAVKATGEKVVKNKSRKSKDVRIKPLTEHDLSVEQQLFYKEITEACVGSEEGKRTEALASLSQDPGLHKILPRIATFISEGVKINCVNHNLAILIYLMRMLKALMDNPSLYMEKYLHELLPAVMTCIVSKQLCIKPESDNHWALRDFSSKILGQICKKFSISTNDIQTRVVKKLSESLHNPTSPLTTVYGCIVALSELGHGVMQSFVIPVVKSVTERARLITEAPSATDETKVTVQHIRTAFIKTTAPAMVALRKLPETMDAYKAEFGPIGAYIHDAVSRLKGQSVVGTSTILHTSGTSRPVSTISSTRMTPRHYPPYRMRPRSSKIPCLSTPVPYPPMYYPYHDIHYPRSAPPFSMHPHHRQLCWAGYSPSKTQGGLTVLAPPTGSSVSRSFSLPMGARSAGSAQPSPMLRASGTAQSLIRTPTTPNTPGSGTGSQKFIIVSAAGGSGASHGSSLVKMEPGIERYNTQSPQPMTLTKALTMQAKAEAQAAGGDQSPTTTITNLSNSLY